MNSQNRISNTFFLLILTLVFLSLFNKVIPETFLTAYNIRKVDYITPLLASTEEIKRLKTNSIAQIKSPTRNLSLNKPDSLTTLEDYSKNGRQLHLLLNAFDQTKSLKENMRIAFYGDSFIEGDLLTMDLRDSLQAKFGGKGIGFLPASSEVSMFRRSLPSQSDNWQTYSISNKSKVNELGIAGSTYIPGENAEIKLLPSKSLNEIQLLYRNNGSNAPVQAIWNHKNTIKDTLRSSENLTVLTLNSDSAPIRHLKLNVEGKEGLKIYGLNIASGKGLYLDNFSIRGNSGLGLKEIPDSQFVAFQKLMNYKLVVLQYGLNVASARSADFSNYEKQMTKMILHLKKLFPETAFLLISTSDRSYKENGNFVTMPSIPLLVEAQRRIAKETGIMFWNMYEAMGGENSMVTMVKDKKANKDYTHLNFEGGKFIADKLYKALMFEYTNFTLKKKNNASQLAVR